MTGFKSKKLIAESRDLFVEDLAMLDSVQELVLSVDELMLEIDRLKIYESAIKRMCTSRVDYDTVDDYIRHAKQAVFEYERFKKW